MQKLSYIIKYIIVYIYYVYGGIKHYTIFIEARKHFGCVVLMTRKIDKSKPNEHATDTHWYWHINFQIFHRNSFSFDNCTIIHETNTFFVCFFISILEKTIRQFDWLCGKKKIHTITLSLTNYKVNCQLKIFPLDLSTIISSHFSFTFKNIKIHLSQK